MNHDGREIPPGRYVPDWVPPGWVEGTPLRDTPEVRERLSRMQRQYRARLAALGAMAMIGLGGFQSLLGVPAALFDAVGHRVVGLVGAGAGLLGGAGVDTAEPPWAMSTIARYSIMTGLTIGSGQRARRSVCRPPRS